MAQHRARLSGPGTGRGTRLALGGRAARFPHRVLRLPGAGDHRARPRTRLARRPRPVRRRRHRRLPAPRRVVHNLAGRPLDRADPHDRHPRRVRALPVPIPRPRRGARARDGAVRAADHRGGLRLREPARPRGTPRRPRARPVARRDPRGPCVLQLRSRRAHRGWALVAPRPPSGGGGTHARRQPTARVPRGHPARAAPRDHRGRGDRVPLHVHVVRRDPRARRSSVQHPGDGDLPPDRAAPPPAARSHAHRGAVGRDHRVAARDRPDRGSPPRRAAPAAPRPRPRSVPARWARDCCSPPTCS